LALLPSGAVAWGTRLTALGAVPDNFVLLSNAWKPGRYLCREMASAIGMDPWEGANIGMTLSGFARLAIGGMKSMASRKNGMSLTEEVRFEAASGQGVREHGHLAGVNRQFNLKEGKTYRDPMTEIMTNKRPAEQERTGRGRDEGTGSDFFSSQ